MTAPRFNSVHRCCFVLSLLLMAVSWAGAQDFTITKLPSLSQPVAINASGQVAGLTTQTGHDSSFFWTRAGGLQILPDLGGGATSAHAMNDSGAIVGESGLTSFSIHAFLWTQTGGIQDLGSPLGGNSSATAINAAGQVVGITYPLDQSSPHAFFWSAATGSVDLGVTGGNTQSSPFGINDSGEVVGYQYGSGGFSAFRWTLAGGMQTIDDFFMPVGFDFVNILNNSGQIGGVSSLDHAALWSGGTVQDLGTLAPDTSSASQLINGNGHIVGTSRPEHCCGHERTFFWTSAGMVDIGTLPNHASSRSVPAGFNNHDQIVGRNGATYFWSPTVGLRQVPGIILKFAPFLSNALNDAGQILGYGAGFKNAVLASPTMHVTVSSSPNPSQAGQAVTLTATVSSIVGAPPDGEQVTFEDGIKVLGTGTLSNGIATLTISTLKVKTHSITAVYAGDDNYLSKKSDKYSQLVTP